MTGLGECKLGDVVRFGNGKARPSTTGNVPIYGGNGILGYCRDANYDGETIVIGRVGAYCGATYYEDQPIWVSDNALSAKPKNDHSAKYLYYLLKNIDLNQQAQGSSHPLVTQTLLNSIGIQIAINPAEQKTIAAILSSLDDKIALLRHQNVTLEAIAETLFRQWFLEGVSDVFETGTISDLIEFNPPRKLKKGAAAPYLEMASLSNATFNPDSWYDRTFSSGTKFINGDTLLARITPCLENGKTAYVTFLKAGEVGWGSTEYIVMRPKGNLHSFFAYSLARSSDFRDYAEGCLAGSSGRQRVDVDHLKNYKIRIPSSRAVEEFNAAAQAITPKLHANSLQIRTLESLRDTLLPKLMSGEVRVQYDSEAA
ncbi:MAG TPA: restriction endonuclease subunit S [Rhodocyclaceae bacterium]|nr:restriction endonuclease subunit S [Rhodocyclaceae bacterium]